MYHTPKSITTHKHLHYHYHYDVNDQYPYDDAQRYSSPSVINSQKSQHTPYKTSWKQQINPEVTKLYEEISLHDSEDNDFTPKASRLSHKIIKEQLNTPNTPIHKRLPKTKPEILQHIQAHEHYLQQHSKPNLYVPNTPTLRRVKSSDSQISLAKKFASLNQLMEHKEQKRKTLEEIILARTESKLIQTKQDLSTMHQTQNPNPSELYFSKKKIEGSQMNVRQSQIQDPRSSISVFERARIRMSHIENPTQRKKNNDLQNSNFSLFQREGKKEESGDNSEVFEHRVRNESESMGGVKRGGEMQKNGDLSYAYELMREECNFLRNKYMEHAEREHGAKLGSEEGIRMRD